MRSNQLSYSPITIVIIALMLEKCKLEKRGAYTVRTQEGREMDICGKCPLELAGYDISQMPIAHILRGQLLGWPPETLRELIPNA